MSSVPFLLQSTMSLPHHSLLGAVLGQLLQAVPF